jgi:signal peptidase I
MALALVSGCGGSASGADLIRQAFGRYLAAIGAGDARSACAELSSSYQARLFAAARSAGIASTSCTSILDQEFKALDPATRSRRRKAASTATVAAVSIRANRADVVVSTPLDGVTETARATLVREGGQWKISEPPGRSMVGRDLVYRVPSGSMEPTLSIGETIVVDPSGYATRPPAIGDIVVFHPPTGADPQQGAVCGDANQGAGHPKACDKPTPAESSQTFIKRVVGTPGDTIAITNGHVIRNGKKENDTYITPCGAGATCSFPTTIRIPANDYFVLGDNRGESDDSRFWGPVKRSWIIGLVVRQLH